MIKKVFLEHPKTVNESYTEHLGNASRFGFSMIFAGFACVIHGLIPCLFKNTGSKMISELHHDMVTHRTAAKKTAEKSFQHS
ncbi:DUF6356 family protein [Parvularcula sp. IMCC14364]|uniref:DUF6356 family protein n=1 Tax=Parvularcula sp. IMCC14364 TaxID=3067902 RepID=UPI0027429325|nr:DUF6356 family protein [Parvularcula sp. IMCC14364]